MDLTKEMSENEGQAQQSIDENKLVAHIKTKVEECRVSGTRLAWLGTTMTNIAYILGFDSCFYDTSRRQYMPLYDNGSGFLKRNRLHANKILPRAQNRAARLCKNPPKYDCMPESSQTEDKDAARLSLEVLNSIWDRQKLNQKRIDLVMWLQQAGYSFLKTSWDPSLGRWMPELGEWEGDVRVEVVSPLEIFPDPTAKSLQECNWVVHCKVRKLDYFRQNYEKGFMVKEEDAWIIDLQYEERVNSMSKAGPTASNVLQSMKNSAIEMCYYEKPSKDYPNGRQIVAANGILLEDKELPIGEIPLAKFDDIKIGGKFISEAVITHARPLQDQITRLLTKRAEWTNRLLAGKYMAPRGHGISPEGLNDQSGELIEYNVVPNAADGGRPTPVGLPVIPQYAYIEEQKLEQSLDDIFGLNEVSNGRLPESGIPAAGMQILLEQDATRIGVVTENHEHAFADCGRHILKFVSKYYKTERIIKIAGEGLDYTVKSFQGSDLRDNHDVFVVRGSTIPYSKEAKRNSILGLYDRGLLGNPTDPKIQEKIMSELEYGDLAEVWQDFSIDMNQINRDLDTIKKGGVPDVEEMDNHPLHVAEKNRYRKSDKFLALDPMAQAVLLSNIEEHLQALIKIQNPGLEQNVEMAELMANQASQLTPQDAMATHEQANANMPPLGAPVEAMPEGELANG